MVWYWILWRCDTVNRGIQGKYLGVEQLKVEEGGVKYAAGMDPHTAFLIFLSRCILLQVFIHIKQLYLKKKFGKQL